MRTLSVLLLLGGVTVGALAWAPWSRGGLGSIPTTVVHAGTFVDYLPARGEIRPTRSVVVTAPSSGADMQILELATNGAKVAAGDVVVQFDSTTQQRAVEQKRSELNQAASELEKVESEARRRRQAADTALAEARSAMARARLDVNASELVSRVEAEKRALILDNAALQVWALEQKVEGERLAAAADVAIARHKHDKARYDVAETERIITSLTLRAPAAGTISLLPNTRAGGPMVRSVPEFKRGDRVWFGAPIAELPDLTSVQMTCRLDEADRARVESGTSVLVRVDAVPDRELKASILEIALVARPDFSSWPPVRNFDAVIAMADTDPRLQSGMSATARIELNRLDNVMVIPSAALFQVNGATVAYVVTGGSAVVRPVTVLRRGRDEVAIQSGLHEGERIALRDPTIGGPR